MVSELFAHPTLSNNVSLTFEGFDNSSTMGDGVSAKVPLPVFLVIVLHFIFCVPRSSLNLTVGFNQTAKHFFGEFYHDTFLSALPSSDRVGRFTVTGLPRFGLNNVVDFNCGVIGVTVGNCEAVTCEIHEIRFKLIDCFILALGYNVSFLNIITEEHLELVDGIGIKFHVVFSFRISLNRLNYMLIEHKKIFAE
jgi:hypothetical protein